MTDYSGAAYDAHNHQLVLWGGGHATTMLDSILTFDIGNTLTWTPLYDPTPCSDMTTGNLDQSLGAWKSGPSGPYPRPVSAHSYEFVVASPDTDEVILLGRAFTAGSCNQAGNDIGGPVAHYDRKGKAWSFADASTQSLTNGLPGTSFDPQSRKFVVLGSNGLALYDPTTRAMQSAGSNLPSASGNPVDIGGKLQYANHMVYFPPKDTFYYLVRGAPVQVYALVLNRNAPDQSTLDLVSTSGPSSDQQEPGYDYDAKHATIGGGFYNGSYFALDPASGVWTSAVVQAPDVAFHTVRWDPADEVFLYIGADKHTWAYRPAP